MIDELSALRTIEERFHDLSDNVIIGIGDDCAAVKFAKGKIVLSTADSQVEDVHFIKSLINPEDLARRAVAVSVSDIAAMGGIARFILASVGFSNNEDEGYLDSLILGFKSAMEEFGVLLIGGNLTSSEKLFIDITVLGEVDPTSVVRRKGASPGDLIYVSGTLGDSALGLKLIQNSGISKEQSTLVKRYIMPEPRLVLGRRIGESGLANAMIDVSDGLLLDLERITTMQGMGARLNVHDIPVSADYREHVSEVESDFYSLALSGGEDYELLFTTPESNRARIQKLSQELDLYITEIGYVVSENNLKLTGSHDEDIVTAKRGFLHFGT